MLSEIITRNKLKYDPSMSFSIRIFSVVASSPIKQGFVCVCLSICVCHSFFLPCSYHLVFMKLTQNIRLKGQRSHRLFEVFVMSAPWLLAYLTNPLYNLHKYNPKDDDISHTISRSKGWRSRSQRLFKFKVTWVVQIFCHACSVAWCLFDRFVSYLAQLQPMSSRCVAHCIYFKRSKV